MRDERKQNEEEVTMSCDQLQRLLNDDATNAYGENTERLVAHMRSCPRCQQGIMRLSQALIANDTLSCEQCRDCLPTFYEATRPAYPLVQMAEREIKAILIHLSHCAECQDDYQFLAMVAEVESKGEADNNEMQGS